MLSTVTGKMEGQVHNGSAGTPAVSSTTEDHVSTITGKMAGQVHNDTAGALAVSSTTEGQFLAPQRVSF